MEREGEGQRERQRQRERVRVRSRLQDQRRAAGARRHVGHAPKLRREQRAGGLLEASHSSLTTASAADLRAFDGHARRRLPDSAVATVASEPACPGVDRSSREMRAREPHKFAVTRSAAESCETRVLGTGKGRVAARERETERSGEARNDAQGSRECGESGGVHGAQVARPACGG